MTLIEAILSGKPFRRPKWVKPDDEFQWVILNPEDNYFDWADEDGKLSGNVFASLEMIVKDNDEVIDYEIKE